MKNLLKIAVLGLLTFAIACGNPEKLLENGNYDQSVEVAVKRLRGKNKKEKHVRVLEAAFNKALQDDLRQIDRLSQQGANANWGKVVSIYKDLDARQQLVYPFLPLVSDNGYKATVNFFEVNGPLAEAEEKAAAQHYVRALDLLEESKNGNYMSAREAYKELNKIAVYRRNYKNSGELKRQARNLGTVHVQVDVKQHHTMALPPNLWREVSNLPLAQLDRNWTVFHNKNSKHSVDYHYSLELLIDRVLVSPERIQERSYVDKREIEKEKYVYDSNGNVAKDSLGNDIVEIVYKEIRAEVLEVYQTKSVNIQANARIKEFNANRIVEEVPLYSEIVFENYASTFRGNRKALSNESRQRIGNEPVPFPTNQLMMREALDKLQVAFINHVRSVRYFS